MQNNFQGYLDWEREKGGKKACQANQEDDRRTFSQSQWGKTVTANIPVIPVILGLFRTELGQPRFHVMNFQEPSLQHGGWIVRVVGAQVQMMCPFWDHNGDERVCDVMGDSTPRPGVKSTIAGKEKNKRHTYKLGTMKLQQHHHNGQDRIGQGSSLCLLLPE